MPYATISFFRPDVHSAVGHRCARDSAGVFR
jgi:hypothetical protein